MKTIISKLNEVNAIAPEFSITIGTFKMQYGIVNLPIEMKHKHIQFLKENGGMFDLSKKRKATNMNGNEFILDVTISINKLESIQKFNGKNEKNAQLFSFMNNHSLALLDFPFKREGLSQKGVMSRFIKYFPKADKKLKINERLKMFKKGKYTIEKMKTTFYFA